jgi:hypothetical protein
MLEKLRSSLLTPAHAKKLHLMPMTEDQARTLKPPCAPVGPGFKIPYFTPAGKLDDTFYRYRFLPYYQASRGWASAATPTKPLRYVQPGGTELHVYMPPLLPEGGCWRDVMNTPEIDLDVTEGELKSACGCVHLRATLGLGGVFSWTSRTHKQPLIPVLEAFKWRDRRVNLIFDSDRASNPLVQLAASRLALALTARGAMVYDVLLPPAGDEKKQGLDDYILAHGAEAYLKLFDTASPVEASLELHRLNEEVGIIWGGGAAGNVIRFDDGKIITPTLFTRSVYKDRTYLEYGVTKTGEPAVPKVRYAAEEWLAWPCRTRVMQVTYTPGDQQITAASEYNLWRPPSITPAKGDTSPWEDLLKRMFIGIDPEHLLWFRRWLAYPIQRPGSKLFSCALFWSHRGGTGKNLLAEALIPIYGESNCVTIKSRHLMSDFNAWAEAKQLVIGDEITLDDKRHTSGDLKSMLTNRVIRINRKGIEAYEVPDCANYILTSNDPVAIVLDQGERRTFVHHAPEEPIGDQYGVNFKRWLYGYPGPPWTAAPAPGAGAHALAWVLLNQPLGDFSPTAEPPDTQAKLELISDSRSDVDTWAAAVRLDPDKMLAGHDPKFAPTSGATNGRRQEAYAIYTPEDLLKLYDPEEKKRASLRSLGIALARAGFRKASSNNGRLNNVRATFWLIKDPEPKRAPITSTVAAQIYRNERPERFVPPSQRPGTGNRVQ